MILFSLNTAFNYILCNGRITEYMPLGRDVQYNGVITAELPDNNANM